jgi:predicted transcriptional regulator of viral defense system
VGCLVKQYTDVSPDYALRRLQRKGVLQRLKNGPRGLYVVAEGKNGKFITDPIEAIQAVCGKEVVFGYGTALFMYGLSRYGRLTEYYVISKSKQKQRPLGEFNIRFVKTRLPKETAIITKHHSRGSVCITDLERTLIDAIHRPKYAQGWENVAHALNRAEGVSGSRMIEYVKQYRTPSLVSRVGLVIQRYAEKWKVAENEIDSLRPYLPKTPVKFARGMGGTLNRQWNIHVPEGLFID